VNPPQPNPPTLPLSHQMKKATLRGTVLSPPPWQTSHPNPNPNANPDPTALASERSLTQP